MTYGQLVKKIQKAAQKTDASVVGEHVAIQVNVTGEAEGIFYIEIAEGKVNVEPFEYYDRDAQITGNAEDLVKLMNGKLDPIMAYSLGMITVEGDLDKALLIRSVIK